MKILYFVDPEFDYHSVRPDSFLLDNSIELIKDGFYHTSIIDCQTENILRHAREFDEIFMLDEHFDKKSFVYSETSLLYSYLQQYKTRKNYQERFLSMEECQTRTHQKNLWVFGCSNSFGTGLEVYEKNYGTLLSNLLDLPLRLVSQPGSSVQWSTRHLFAAAIEPQDTVVWQITAPERITRFDGTKVTELQLALCRDRSIIDCFSDEQIYFEHFSLIHYGVRYLRSIGCQFKIISFIGKSNFHDLAYLQGYMDLKEFCPISDLRLDHGNDKNQHPGPTTHQKVAERLFTEITQG